MGNLIKRNLPNFQKGTILCLRFHHGLADGFSMVDAFLNLADNKNITVLKNQQVK